jgi:predicted aldo/keto reductase-like oxidoreductase
MQIHAELAKLREEGVIRHVGFSAHSYFDKALALISTGGFELCMLGYGYLARGYNQVLSPRMIELRNTCIAKAHEQNMGLVAMKVISAGMLGAFSGSVVPGFDKERSEALPAAAISYVLQDERIHMLAIGMRVKEEIDANISIVSGEADYSLDKQGLLAEFTAQALNSNAIKALRVD